MLATFAWAILLAFVCLLSNWRYVCDDAYITLRYARILPRLWSKVEPERHGGGGFFQPAAYAPLAALAVAHIPLVSAARWLDLLATLLLLFLWRFMVRRDGRMAAALVCALVIASWTILVWDLGGLE